MGNPYQLTSSNRNCTYLVRLDCDTIREADRLQRQYAIRSRAELLKRAFEALRVMYPLDYRAPGSDTD